MEKEGVAGGPEVRTVPDSEVLFTPVVGLIRIKIVHKIWRYNKSNK